MKKLTVILDYDDVLVDCNGYAVEKLNKEIGSHYSIYDITAWGPLGNDLDKRLKYFSDPNFVATMPVLAGAKEFVAELTKIAETLIMTSVEYQCAGARYSHVLENFKEINPGNIIIGNRKDMIKGDLILDDGHHNLANSKIAYPVLFQKPWNFSKTGILSVNGYDAFLQLVRITRDICNKDMSKLDAVSLIGATGSGKKELAARLIQTGKFERVKTYTTKKDNNYHVLDYADFTNRRENGFFSETSMYMGEFYGMRVDDIARIREKGKIPLMILDINGAMSLQLHCNALNVYVRADKEVCTRSILKRNITDEEKVRYILSLDRELCNEDLCDIAVDSRNWENIMKYF